MTDTHSAHFWCQFIYRQNCKDVGDNEKPLWGEVSDITVIFVSSMDLMGSYSKMRLQGEFILCLLGVVYDFKNNFS